MDFTLQLLELFLQISNPLLLEIIVSSAVHGCGSDYWTEIPEIGVFVFVGVLEEILPGGLLPPVEQIARAHLN